MDQSLPRYPPAISLAVSCLNLDLSSFASDVDSSQNIIATDSMQWDSISVLTPSW
jgi:hypothetical protein